MKWGKNTQITTELHTTQTITGYVKVNLKKNKKDLLSCISNCGSGCAVVVVEVEFVTVASAVVVVAIAVVAIAIAVVVLVAMYNLES